MYQKFTNVYSPVPVTEEDALCLRRATVMGTCGKEVKRVHLFI